MLEMFAMALSVISAVILEQMCVIQPASYAEGSFKKILFGFWELCIINGI